MNFFYTPKEYIDEQNGELQLTGEEAHHLVNVLRYQTGQEVDVVDGEGNHFTGTISLIRKKEVWVDIHSVNQQTGSLTSLALGVIKNRQRLEFAIEKAVELGAGRILLFDAMNSEKSKVRLNRIRKIVLSAMKQSLRAHLPEIQFYQSLDEVIERQREETFLVAHEKSSPIAQNPVDWAEIRRRPHTVFIGPEGGFAGEEIHKLGEGHGAYIVYLGKARLRTETAVVATLSHFLPFNIDAYE